MDDLISRQAAINALDDNISIQGITNAFCVMNYVKSVKQKLEQLPSALPKPHGRLIDADALAKMCQEMQSIEWNNKAAPYSWAYAYESFESDIDNAPTIIPAEEDER